MKRNSARTWTLLAIGAFGALAAHAQVPLRGFSNVGLMMKKADDNTSGFYTGGLDLYLARRIDDRVSFMSEVEFELDDQNNLGVDVERLAVQYFVSQWLNISLGRTHTGLGFWNETYHHGSYLATTIERPLMMRFEDDNGILPVHSSGLAFRGEGEVGPGKLGYIANIANGRGPKSDPPQTKNDADNAKAVGAVLYYKFDDGPQIGVTAYNDTLPGFVDPTSAVVSNRGHEFIWGAHIAYLPSSFEFLTEALRMQHTYTTGEESSDVFAMYTQFGVHWELWTPYVRFDHIDAKAPDSYTGVAGARNGITAGLRYELSSSSALKLEYFNLKQSHATTEHTVAADWSFGF